MTITWILLADQSRARLFEYRSGQALTEIQDFINPGGRQREGELRHDSRGRFSGTGVRDQGHTAEPVHTAGDQDADRFARSLDHFLAKARSEHGFDRLCLVAPQRFLGRLRANMPPAVSRVPGEDIPHEVAAWNAHDLEPWLRQRGVLR